MSSAVAPRASSILGAVTGVPVEANGGAPGPNNYTLDERVHAGPASEGRG